MQKQQKVFSDSGRIDLFAGYHVRDFAASVAWYERLFGLPPAFLPNEIEAVWELADYRYVFIKVAPEHAGHAYNLCFLSDLDAFIASAAKRGIEPTTKEALPNGVRKVVYQDPDGNEVGFGGAPV